MADIDLTVEGTEATVDGVIFVSDAEKAAGSGIYGTFLSIEETGAGKDGVESGFNTDGQLQLDDTRSNFTNALPKSSLVSVNIDGTDYYVFKLDANEPNGKTGGITLSQFKIYSGADGSLTSLPGTPLYDMDASGGTDLLLNSGKGGANGSGEGDLFVYVPVTMLASSDNYVYLYTEFTHADSGFEEWAALTDTSGGGGGGGPPPPTPDLSVIKTAEIVNDGGTLGSIDNAGEDIQYTIKVRNDGNVALTNVVLTDPLTGLVLGAAVESGGVASLNGNGILDVGETWTYTGTYDVQQADIDNSGHLDPNLAIVNSVSVDSDQTDPDDEDGNDTDSISTAIIQNPDLSVIKTAEIVGNDEDGKIDSVDDDIAYTIKVHNDGNMSLTGVVLTDSLVGLTLGSPAESGGDPLLNGNGILDVGETWTYTGTYDVKQADINNGGQLNPDLAITNNVSVDSDQTDPTDPDGDDKASVSTAVVQNPQIDIQKVTTGVTGAGADHILGTSDDTTATGDNFSFLAGTDVKWTYTVTNTGNVDLTGLAVTDNQPGVTPTLDLAHSTGAGDNVFNVGDVWVYTATGTAVVGAYSNVGTAAASFGSTPVPDTDGSNYTGTFTEDGRPLTQGFWGSHSDAWDNAGKIGNPTKSAVASGVLSSSDVNPRTDGYLLLGDSNGNGIADDAHDLKITIGLAKAIESSSTSGDARMIMLQQAIAAQLNIDNEAGANHSGPNGQPVDLIDEAVMWLTGKGAWAGLGVNVDANNDGVVDGTTTALGGSAVATSSGAWHNYVTVTDDISYSGPAVKADGEGLKNALMWWNDGHLVTSTAGQVAYDTDGVTGSGAPVNAHVNTGDEFWLTLSQTAGLIGISH